MKTVLLSTILGITLFLPNSADAVYVTIDSSSRYYRNQPIMSNWNKTVGLVGDYFELRDGRYTLMIAAPRQHYAKLKIDVKRNNLEINIDKGQSFDKNGCKEEWITGWRGQLKKERFA